MTNQNAKIFRDLHQNTTPLLLPNAWDAAGAGLFEQAGAKAIATTSAGMAWSLGYQDGRSLPTGEVVAAASRMMRVLKAPLSVDIENGYSDDPKTVADFVQRLADIGVAGINIEDGTDHPDLLASKIEAIRKTLSKTDSDIFVNARCDVFLANLVPSAQKVEETITRGRQYETAGADGLFVPAVSDKNDIGRIAGGAALPLNVLVWPGIPTSSALAALGVRRLSAGSALAEFIWGVAEHTVKDFLANGVVAPPLSIGPRNYSEMQLLFPAN